MLNGNKIVVLRLNYTQGVILTYEHYEEATYNDRFLHFYAHRLGAKR